MILNKYFIEPELEISHLKRYNASYIRKEFIIEKKIKKATLIITSCGIFHGYINGIKVDNQLLLPKFTQYDKRLFYFTYDITDKLTDGANVIAALVGDGWYRGDVGWYTGRYRNIYGTKIKLMAMVTLEYEDSTVETFHTDESWKASQDGPHRKNSLVCGEFYDARYEMDGWNLAGFDDSAWHNVLPSEHTGALVPEEGEKVLEQERYKPKLIITPLGEKVLDFGQNLAGYVEFKVKGKAGQRVKLIHGERLDKDGNFFLPPKDARSKYQSLSYTLKDGVQTFKPYFSYNGFQYVWLKNWPGEVNPDDFTSIAIYSDLPQLGTFTCSNPLVNQFVNNARWSQKSNFVDIPTDCPTRERAGWTGDIGLYCETACYFMDTYDFLKKWLKDVALQQFENGCIPSVVPYMKYPHFMDGSSGWADAAVIVPMRLYHMYGKIEILENQYECMKKWIDFSISRAKKCAKENRDNQNPYLNYLLDQGYHWGEWLEPGADAWGDIYRNRKTADSEVATAYFSYTTGLFAEASRILGKDDVAYYENIAKLAAKAYRWQYIEIEGGVQSPRQCRYIRPIALKVTTDEQRKVLASELNDMLIQNDYMLNTGYLSTCWLLPVLTENGYAETAYKTYLNESPGAWMSHILNGATSIWEQWDGVSSRNHYGFGAVVGWLFKYVAGIQPLEAGFQKVLIKPYPSTQLNDIDAVYNSVAGKIHVKWSIAGNEFTLDLETPVSTIVILPDGEELQVEKGTYTFTSKL